MSKLSASLARMKWLFTLQLNDIWKVKKFLFQIKSIQFKFLELGTTKDLLWSLTATTDTSAENISRVRYRILQNPDHCVLKLASEIKIREFSVQIIVKTKLRLRSYRANKAQLLVDRMKTMRMKKCQLVICRIAHSKQWKTATWKSILSSL